MSRRIDINLCDCGKATVYAKGLCFKHYKEAWRKTTTAPLVHGKPSTYSLRGCRCVLCVAANSAYQETWRANR